MSFHELRFPTDISIGSFGGPERQTEIVVLGSGYEERNSRWAHSRRRYNAGYGIKHLRDLDKVLHFFEERRGRLYGFRWKDGADFRSVPPGDPITSTDQTIGTGDGSTTLFQIVKKYGSIYAPYDRPIKKPVAGTLKVAVNGNEATEDTDYVVNLSTGEITFTPASIPALGDLVTAGFEFDIPVRFDTDKLNINLSHFEAGEVTDIPVVEILI